MGPRKQHDQNDPDLMPLTDADSLDDWEGIAAPGPVRVGMTVSVCFDLDSAAVIRSAARLSERTLAEFVRQATLTARDGCAPTQLTGLPGRSQHRATGQPTRA